MLSSYFDRMLERETEQGKRENLLFLIDGFDEIAGVHKQNFLKQVELYRNENKEARFLISPMISVNV